MHKLDEAGRIMVVALMMFGSGRKLEMDKGALAEYTHM